MEINKIFWFYLVHYPLKHWHGGSIPWPTSKKLSETGCFFLSPQNPNKKPNKTKPPNSSPPSSIWKQTTYHPDSPVKLSVNFLWRNSLWRNCFHWSVNLLYFSCEINLFLKIGHEKCNILKCNHLYIFISLIVHVIFYNFICVILILFRE